MTDQNSRAGFVRRLVCGTIAAAGIVGAMAVTTGPAVDSASPVVVDAAMTQPLQPPPPPPGWPPPTMHEPGQQGPGSSQHETPPPPLPPAGDDRPICQDIMGVDDVNQPCYDPSDIA